MKFWSKKYRHSLTGKLLLLFVVVGILFIAIVTSSIGKYFSRHFESNIRPHLIQYAEYVQQDIGIPPDRQRAAILAEKLKVDIYFDEPAGRWSSNDRLINEDELEFKRSFYHKEIEYGVAMSDGWGDDLELFWARLGETTIYIGIPDLRPERSGSSFIHLLLPLLILFLLYRLILRLIRPIRVLSDGVKRFGKGELEHRIEIDRRDELGELAGTFNNMADDIEQMLDAKRQLLLAISHELRSPLTRAKVSLELMREHEQSSELGVDLKEMESLIEELLETERLSDRHQTLHMQNQDLNLLVVELIERHFVDSGIVIKQFDIPLLCDVDVTRIKLLVKNLLENALRHTPECAQPPRVSLDQVAGFITITVEDSGCGIEADQIPHLTEPFYRADASRRRETGGYGLGLYLCRVIAEAHGGELVIHSKPGEGTAVVVKLPN